MFEQNVLKKEKCSETVSNERCPKNFIKLTWSQNNGTPKSITFKWTSHKHVVCD